MIRPMTESHPTLSWRLWIDRCGGYGLLSGDRFSVGGSRPGGTTDVQVRSDWRRHEGDIVRRDGDYFWSRSEEGLSSAWGGEELLASAAMLPISGSATMRLHKPSPLSGSAVLSLDPPHRFDQHVDQILLVDQTILIGPGSQSHIRCTAIDVSAVMVLRAGKWQAKLKSEVGQGGLLAAKPKTQFIELVPGRRVSLGELDMMLEIA